MTQLQQLFKGLVSDESMPETLGFIKNGVETMLMKMKGEDGEFCYVGTPRFKGANGKWRLSEHSLVVTADCRVEGTYALNSIAVGGWRRNSTDPGHEVRAQLREEMVNTLITAAILIKQGHEVGSKSLQKAIERECGFPIIYAPSTPEQEIMMTAVGIKNHIAEILSDKGWSLEIYPQDLIKNLSRYAEVESGEWDQEARSIAVTSSLELRTVKALKSLNYTLKKRVINRKSKGTSRQA